MNHCIARDTCSALPQTENSVIESYKTEREVLLAWTKLIQEEDPDIIIGYNIFGFDYQFMFLRAKELGCVNSFLQLSRNKREVCIKKDWRTGKEGLEENTLFIASGQHDLKFVKMTGRLQVDLYNFLRRDYQLTKYKLDYVSGYFIGDNVARIEHVDDMTKVYSKNLTGLEAGNFVNFEEVLPEDTPNQLEIIPPGQLPPQEFFELPYDPVRGPYPGVFDYKFTKLSEVHDFNYWAMLLWDKITMIATFHDPACTCARCAKDV